MHNWTVRSGTISVEGQHDTAAGAWDQAHDATATMIDEHGIEAPFTLTVDGVPSMIRPPASGDHDADVAATREILETGRQALVGAYRAAE